ncbi:hypothetical protein BC830DRAFT_459167 [Chytriomyces sp. MP71]|nr:hypothetical protein BC830DRAFT_459167 [Chytriomyces sp. MP71]
MAYYEAKSGDVIVIPESNRVVRRWRDNIQWSPSRAFGPFLLYRQVEPIPKNTVTSIPLKYSFRRVQSNVAALEPTFSAKTLKAGTRVMENGLTKRTISLTGSDGQKHRVISYYTPNDVIEMCQREADGFEPAYGEEVFQRPSKCPMLIDAMKSKAMNLNQLLKQQNLYQESTFKSFRIASESPKSEAWPDELDTRSSKRQKKEASKLHMPQEESGAHQSQTPVNEILSRRPPHPQPQPSKSSVPCEPRTFSANANPQVNSNSFHSRTLYYPYLQPPHIMGRPPIIHTYPLKRSPTHESFQPQSQYHQQPKPDEAPVVYNLPVGVSLPDLAPRSNCLRQVPPRPSYFHRPPHLQHHSAPPNEPYYPTMHYPTMQGTYGPYLPYHAFQGPPLGYTPPHPYGAPPPLTYPGYVSMPPAGMHVHGAGLGRQQPVYFVGPSQLGPPSLPRNSVKVGHDFQDE